LLLAAPAMVGDPERLARSSIASLEHVDASTVPHYDVVFQAIEQQRRDLSILEDASGQVFDPDAGVQESVWSAIANRLNAHDVAVADLGTRLDASDESVGALGERVGAAAADLSGVESALAGIESRLATVLDRLEGIAGSVDALQGRVANLEATTAALADSVDRFDIRVAGLATRVTVNEEQLTALRDGVTEVRSSLGELDDRLAQHDTRLERLDEAVADLTARHTQTGLLAVSGSEGLAFQVRETGASGVVPAVLELPPGTYTLAARLPTQDTRSAVANLQQAPPIVVQAIVRADQATGVTIPVGGR
jgi:chromosome segregation ATPase